MEFRPIPIAIEIIQRIVLMSRILLLRKGGGVILLGPSALDPLTARHARIRLVNKRVIDLTIFVMSVDMHLRTRSADTFYQWQVLREVPTDAIVEVLRELAPDIIAD